MPMDDDGLMPDALEQALAAGETPAFLYTIPTFQNPSGRTLSDERRRRARRARRASATCSCSRTTRTGSSATRASRCRRSSSSRAASRSRTARRSRRRSRPGVRVGWFVLPPAARGRDRGARGLDVHLAAVPDAGDGATSSSRAATSSRTSSASTACCARGATRCSRRSSAHLPEDATWTRPEGGYFVWLELPSGPPTRRAARASGGGGRHVRPGHRLLRRRARAASRSLRLAFSFVSPDEIAEGVAAPRAAAERRARDLRGLGRSARGDHRTRHEPRLLRRRERPALGRRGTSGRSSRRERAQRPARRK